MREKGRERERVDYLVSLSNAIIDSIKALTLQLANRRAGQAAGDLALFISLVNLQCVPFMNSILARYNTREAASGDKNVKFTPFFILTNIWVGENKIHWDYRESWLDCRWRRRKLEFNYIFELAENWAVLTTLEFIYYCIFNIYSFFVATQELSFHAHFKPHNSEAVNVLCYYCKSMFHCFTFLSRQIPIFDIFLYIRHLVQIWRV